MRGDLDDLHYLETNVIEEDGFLNYPENSFIRWNDEYFKVLRSFGESGDVMTTDGTIVTGFRFCFQGEQAVLVDDQEKISELEHLLRPALTWHYCANCSPDSQEDCQKCWKEWDSTCIATVCEKG